MKPLYLYLENFMGHQLSAINLENISSILIVGKACDSDLYSNGVGKSTIFRAIEFCLFNECENGLKLEKLIRDDTLKCKVVLDFSDNNKFYKVSRARSKKGSIDLSLFERNSYEEDKINAHELSVDNPIFSKFWNDISSRRVPDTEENLFKIHKMTYNAFCGGHYFMQNDYTSGIAIATKSKRKEILKNILQQGVYTHLAKLASNKNSAAIKDLEKQKTLIEVIGEPDKSLKDLKNRVLDIEPQINEQIELVNALYEKNRNNEKEQTDLTNKFNDLQSKVFDFFKLKNSLNIKFNDINKNINDFSDKRKNIISQAKAISADIKNYENVLKEFKTFDFSIISQLELQLSANKEKNSENTALINSFKNDLVELRIPIPAQGVCKHCRQVLTDEHRKECQKSTDQEILQKETKIKELSKNIKVLTDESQKLNTNLSKLKKDLDNLNNSKQQKLIKEKELLDRKSLYNEYDLVLNDYKLQLDQINIEINNNDLNLKASSAENLDFLSKNITDITAQINKYNNVINNENKKLSQLSNEKAIILHSITEKENDIKKKAELLENIKILEEEYSILPDIVEAFGPSGIPSLIIQNVLNDLQIEANIILEQIKPGLQLNFTMEEDDLDINYLLHTKPRDYQQLSGAQKLCVMFSLKLGIAYLLKKVFGSNFNLLLLDEIDQSLDKAGSDAFAEIIKFFSKDFTILVITHNDRLKDKFSHAILVEQDSNLISTAKIVTSW